MESIVINNDTVNKMNYDIYPTIILKYHNTRVWPTRVLDTPYSGFDSLEEVSLIFEGRPEDVFLSRDGEHFEQATNHTISFGGDAGPLYIYCVNDGISNIKEHYDTQHYTPPYSIGGNITRLKGETEDYSCKSYAGMFAQCYNLVDASELRFPIIIEGDFSLNAMFARCTNLVYPPKVLPASIVPDNGYDGMFFACHSLIEPPIILAKQIGKEGCARMFENCSSLTKRADLSTVQVAGQNAYLYMYLNTPVG